MAVKQRVELVVIGASTGGPAALIRILPLLPVDLPVPVLIVLHLPVGYAELMARTLSSRGDFVVSEAKSGDPILPGQAWIAPGNWHMTLVPGAERHRFHLHQGAPVNSCRPSVDVLFSSAAREVGGGVLGVVLTGMGSDGVEGSRAIREAGGTVLVQDEESAVVWGMPGQVQRSGQADRVVSLHSMAGEIEHRVRQGRVRLPAPVSRHQSTIPKVTVPVSARELPVIAIPRASPVVLPQRSSATGSLGNRTRSRLSAAGMEDGDFEYVRELVERRSGVQLVAESMPLALMRLGNLARSLGFDSPSALVQVLRAEKSADLTRQTVEAVVNSETYFFRDQHPFEALRTRILPNLIEARRSTRTLRIWSAACSGGQEPYSLAMMIRRYFRELGSWNVQILATDFSGRALTRARAGRYNKSEAFRGLSEEYRRKYLWEENGSYEVVPEVRRLVEFRQLNLTRPWRDVPSVDLLLLRNVLFYFNMDTRRSILGRVRDVLGPDGVLVLGATESTLAIDRSFEAVRVDRTTWFRLRDKAA